MAAARPPPHTHTSSLAYAWGVKGPRTLSLCSGAKCPSPSQRHQHLPGTSARLVSLGSVSSTLSRARRQGQAVHSLGEEAHTSHVLPIVTRLRSDSSQVCLFQSSRYFSQRTPLRKSQLKTLTLALTGKGYKAKHPSNSAWYPRD